MQSSSVLMSNFNFFQKIQVDRPFGLKFRFDHSVRTVFLVCPPYHIIGCFNNILCFNKNTIYVYGHDICIYDVKHFNQTPQTILKTTKLSENFSNQNKFCFCFQRTSWGSNIESICSIVKKHVLKKWHLLNFHSIFFNNIFIGMPFGGSYLKPPLKM